jgi:putative FmdB family regulatory protein
MPIYEYECDGCHSVFEVRQKVSDPAPTEHSCGSTQVRRILSATSFVLKGTGWYATDYGNRSQKPESGSSAKAEASGKGGALDASKSAAKSDVGDKAPAASGKPAGDKAPPSKPPT